MPCTRVLLVGMPRMLGDIVRELFREDPEHMIVGEVADRAMLLPTIRALAPDVVLVGLRDADIGPDWDRMFADFPNLRVMAISPDGRRAGVFSEVIPEQLLRDLPRAAPEGEA